MRMKTRFFVMGVLVMILAFAAFQALQKTQQPAESEDPCTAVIQAGMQSQNNTGAAATEDAALVACLEALASPGMSAKDSIGPALEGPNDSYISISISYSNTLADAGRVWVIWHDPSTGALAASLGAYNTRLSYYNMGLDITIPINVVNIGIRIETTQDRSSDKWEFQPTCAFVFAKPPQGFSVTVDDDNVCTGQSASA